MDLIAGTLKCTRIAALLTVGVAATATLTATALSAYAAGHVHGAGPIWLSEGPPDAHSAARLSRSHGGPVEMGRGGSTSKRMWLRSGPSPAGARYLSDIEVEGFSYRVAGPYGDIPEGEPFAAMHGTGLYFPMAEEGFYNAYAVRRQVVDGVLRVETAKAEVLRHLCSAGHDYSRDLVKPRIDPDVPLDLVRLRLPDEDFHTRIASGDDLGFRAFRHGEPVDGAAIRLVSARDWGRTVATDNTGEARFQMVRDYYPPWEIFERRRRDPFLVVAEYTETREGVHDGEPYHRVEYITTLPGIYSPPPRDYMSYAYGLGAALVAFSTGTLGLVLYRRRRWTGPREERFDEKA